MTILKMVHLWVALNKDIAFIFMIIAEEELKNKINEYIIIETLEGRKIWK